MGRSQQVPAQTDADAALCRACGLCCNGVLFADVKLLARDDSLVLEQEGVVVEAVGRGRRFRQPCPCLLDGGACAIYVHRPRRCRQFDCHTLKQTRSRAITTRTALRRIREAQAEAERVRQLLRQVGQHDEGLALTDRYQLAMSQPLDLANDPDAADKRGELMMAVNDLMHRLHRDFLE